MTSERRRLLVTGSRTWTDTTVIREALAAAWRNGGPEVVLVSGGCPAGADTLCEACWTQWGGQVERWPADWQRHGKSAGFRRNQAMVDTGADLCLAFIHRRSAGATHCAVAAIRAGITTSVFQTES